MNSADYRVRRATTDDLGQLTSLWKSAQLSEPNLEKRLTEFQIVESPDGQLLGALGLQVAGSEGKLHSEAYTDFGHTDRLRPLLWERICKVASNHGLFRLWTNESAPFWKKECGFVEASNEVRATVPPEFITGRSTLLVLQLREDRAAPSSLDAEFAKFRAEEKLRTDKMFQQARLFKGIAWGLALVLFVFVAVGVIYLLRARGRL